ncbi:MAG: DUF2868 domain-containing protein [Castellaniella sp.]
MTSAFPDMMAQVPGHGLRAHWMAESLRLREAQWGPLEDSRELRSLRRTAAGRPLETLVLERARLLAQREGLDTVITRWASSARLALIILLLAAMLVGAGAAAGVLGDGERPVNLMAALTALLGLHSLSLLLWWLSPLLPRTDPQAGLGELWLRLSARLARGPDTLLAMQGLAGLLGRRRVLRSALGSISHAWWLVALLAALLTLLGLLSTRRYGFGWETTLLSADTMVWLAQTLGWLPGKLGFAIPPAELIRMSDGLHPLPDSAHALWSAWLLGCLVCYGLLPRTLVLILSVLRTRRGLRRMQVDMGLPGLSELRERLQAPSRPGGIDSPASPPSTSTPAAAEPHMPDDAPAIVGLELAADTPWPPGTLAPGLRDLGMVDSRAQREQLLLHLEARPPARLLLVCDGRQTPDRGTIAWLGELAHLAPYVHLTLLGGDARPERAQAWQRATARAGLPPDALHGEPAAALAWLAGESTVSGEPLP